MATTAKGFPYPVTGDGRPHIDQAMALLAARVEAVLAALTDAEITALAGVDLWDGRLAYQTNTGAARLWKGLYEYQSGLPGWEPIAPSALSTPYTPVMTVPGGTAPNVGTDGNIAGFYWQFGDLIFGRLRFLWGTAANGATVGSGASWNVTLPIAAGASAVAGTVLGMWRSFRSAVEVGSPDARWGAIRIVDSTHVKFTSDIRALASADAEGPNSHAVGQSNSILGGNFRYRRT